MNLKIFLRFTLSMIITILLSVLLIVKFQPAPQPKPGEIYCSQNSDPFVIPNNMIKIIDTRKNKNGDLYAKYVYCRDPACNKKTSWSQSAKWKETRELNSLELCQYEEDNSTTSTITDNITEEEAKFYFDPSGDRHVVIK